MNGKVIAIVQARFRSRLPGKVLLPLAGHSVLWHLRQRLGRVPEIDEIVFATTAQDSDRPVVEEVESWGGTVFAYPGDVNDLLSRYLECGAAFDADIIVMVDGDCPLVHPETLSAMVNALRDRPDHDYAKLDSASIEGGAAVLRLNAYRKIDSYLGERVPRKKRSAYREHATLCIMENPDWFSIVPVPCFEEFKGIKHRLWLDTPADYEFLQAVYDEKYPGNGGIVSLPEVVELLTLRPELIELNAHVGQKQATHAGETVLLEGDGEMADRLMEILPTQFGFSVARNPSPEVAATIRLQSSEDDFELSQENGNALITVGTDCPRDLSGIVSLIAEALGGAKLESGYFDTEARSDEMIEVDCPLCGSAEVTPLWEAPTEAINGICDRCAHVFLHRRPSPRQLEENYRHYAQSYPVEYRLRSDTAFGEIAKQRAKRIVNLMDSRPGPVSVLELGSGDGHFLAQVPADWLRVSVEPSRDQAAFLRRYRDFDEVWQCGYEEFQVTPPSWPEGGFDVVVSFHVLEHVANPVAFLEFVHGQLAADGLAVIAVPNLENLGRDLIEFHYLANGFHLQTFHRTSLQALAERCGFRIDRMENECRTAALKSSLLAVLCKSDSPSSGGISERTVDTVRETAREFHDALEVNLTALRNRFASWQQSGKKVMIFGAGVHTESLFAAAPEAPRFVTGVIDDDDTKHGSILAGHTVGGRDSIATVEPDVIVVSSLSAEDRILESLDVSLTEAVGIYRDLFNPVTS